jgi:hypothetical protein
MSLDEKQNQTSPLSEGDASAPAPWPLSTDAVLRVLAWPRYDEFESIKRVLTVAEPLFNNKNGCLCLRHDPDVDIPYEQALSQLQAAFDSMGRAGDLEVLFVDEKIDPKDWPRLGKAVNAVISLDEHLDATREAFIAALGVEIISSKSKVD